MPRSLSPSHIQIRGPSYIMSYWSGVEVGGKPKYGREGGGYDNDRGCLKDLDIRVMFSKKKNTNGVGFSLKAQ